MPDDATSRTLLCPSAQPRMDGCVVFGVLDTMAEVPRVGYLVEARPVTDGNLKVHGNVALGKQMVRRLSEPGPDDTTVNPILYDPSYNPAGPDGGSLTLSGCGLTPGGTVVLNYNLGSETYQSPVTANSSGEFTFTQPGVFCGPLTTNPNIGVIVTATDLSSGKSTTQRYATPC
jgi:hypothetical protein